MVSFVFHRFEAPTAQLFLSLCAIGIAERKYFVDGILLVSFVFRAPGFPFSDLLELQVLISFLTPDEHLTQPLELH